MSTRIPTDIFGRRLNLAKLPFTPVEPHSGPDYDKVFINAEGDKMEGILDMDKHKITNIKAPEKPLDAANKAYVDNIEGVLVEKFKGGIGEVQSNIKKNRDQDLASKELIKKLRTQIDSDLQVKKIRSKLANTKRIPTLAIAWDKGYSITKNIIVQQTLIETDNDCWVEMQSLGSQYGLLLYERYNKKTKRYDFHISATKTLPSSWKRNIIIFCRVLSSS